MAMNRYAAWDDGDKERLRLCARMGRPFAISAHSWRPLRTRTRKEQRDGQEVEVLVGKAFVYLPISAYHYRLNSLCPTDWNVYSHVEQVPMGSTAYVSVAVTLNIAGASRTSLGESAIGPTEISPVLSAEAQAFKRAYELFAWPGWYVDNLPQPWLPMDPKTKEFTQRSQKELIGMVSRIVAPLGAWWSEGERQGADPLTLAEEGYRLYSSGAAPAAWRASLDGLTEGVEDGPDGLEEALANQVRVSPPPPDDDWLED